VPPAIPPLELPEHWRAEPPRSARQRWAWWGSTLLTFAVVALIVIAMLRIVAMTVGRPAHVNPERLLSGIPLAAALVIAVACMLVLHELGHVAGGMRAGWRLQSLFVGPLRILREDDGFHIYWHKIVLLYGGAALVVPLAWETPASQRRARMLYVAGGPATSIIVGVALLLALRATGLHARELFRTDGRTIIFTAALASLAMGLGTLIPHRPGPGLRSDGMQLLKLLRASGSASGAWEPDPAAFHAMVQVQLMQTRPREWAPALVEQIARLPEVDRHTLTYFQLLDRGDARSARDHLQRALDAIAPVATRSGRMQRRSLAFEAACFEAAWRDDVEASRAWTARGGSPRSVDEHGARVAEGARAAVLGDTTGARIALDSATWAMRRSAMLRLDRLRAATIDRIRERIAASGAAG